MNGITLKPIARATAFGVALLAGIAMMPASAQAQAPECDGKSSSGSKTLSPKIFKIVEELQELMEAEQTVQAKGMLDGIRNRSELPVYDQTVLYQFYGQIYAEQEDYVRSAGALEQVIRLGKCILPPDQINETVFNIGQLYIGAEQYRKGMNYLLDWFKDNPDPPATALAFMASANLGIEPPDYREALKWMLRAIEKSKSVGEEPRENWYSTLVALYMETNQMADALPILELLVERHPKRAYWMQLSYVYGELNRDADQFATLEAAYHQGLLTKSQELVYLAQLYTQNEIPIRAGEIMEDAIKSGKVEKNANNLQLLANSLFSARELDRAITWYEEAGKASDKADIYFMLGQIYMQQEEWKKAIASFDNALAKNRAAAKKDKIRQAQVGTLHYNLGIAHYENGNKKLARRSFTNARTDKGMRQSANQWLQRIDAES